MPMTSHDAAPNAKSSAPGVHPRRLAWVVAAAVVCMAITVLAGWVVGSEGLKRVVPGCGAMNPVTALCLILLGVSLSLRLPPRPSHWSAVFAVSPAICVVIGMVRLSGYVTGADFGIDQFLFTQQVVHGASGPNGMGLLTALCFVLCGLSVLMLDYRTPRGLWPAQSLAVIAGLIALLAAIDVFYGIGRLQHVSTKGVMAIHTAGGFMLLAVGVLCARPDRGVLTIVIGVGEEIRLTRRLFIGVLLAPVLMGAARLVGERAGLYGAEFGTALLVVCVVAVMGLIINLSATSLHRAITQRIQAEQALREQQERFDRAVNGSSDGLWDWDLATDNVWYSPRFKELLGYSNGEFPDYLDSFTSHLHPEDTPRVLEAIRLHKELAQPYDVEYRLRTKDGAYRWFRARGKTINDGRGELVRMSGSIQDVTDLKQADQALRDSELRFRSVIDTSVDGIVVIDEHGAIELANPAIERLFGYQPQELLGRNMHLLLPQVDRARHEAYLAQVRMGQRQVREPGREVIGNARRKDGSTFPIQITVGEWRMNGRRLFTGMMQDITARVQAEEQLRQSAAELARSNEDLQEFAYVASHDLRAPLRAIKNLAQWLEEDLAERLDEENRERMDLLLNRVERLDNLIEDLLQYSRAGRVLGRRHSVDLEELLDGVVELLDPPSGFEIVKATALPTFETASTPLHTVLRNLIGNAIKHHDRAAGRIEISAHNAGDFYEFAVSDDGPGIAPKFRERVFGLFETLKPRDRVEGSGMGLAIVRRTIEKLGGAMTLECGDGRGATFRFTWPKSIGREAGPNQISASGRAEEMDSQAPTASVMS